MSARSIGTSSGPAALRSGVRCRGSPGPKASVSSTHVACTPVSSRKTSTHGSCAHSGSQNPPRQPSPNRARWLATPVSTCRRTPASVARSGRIACVALLVQAACGASRPSRPSSPREASSRVSASAYCPAARSSSAASAPAPISRKASTSSRWDAGRTSRRNAAQRSSAPGVGELVADHRRERQGQRRAGVEQVEDRQVARGDRLPQPLLAERPRPEALDVGHVRVEDEADGALALAHGVQTARKSSAPSRSRSPSGTSAKSRTEIAGVKRS